MVVVGNKQKIAVTLLWRRGKKGSLGWSSTGSGVELPCRGNSGRTGPQLQRQKQLLPALQNPQAHSRKHEERLGFLCFLQKIIK